MYAHVCPSTGAGFWVCVCLCVWCHHYISLRLHECEILILSSSTNENRFWLNSPFESINPKKEKVHYCVHAQHAGVHLYVYNSGILQLKGKQHILFRQTE